MENIACAPRAPTITLKSSLGRLVCVVSGAQLLAGLAGWVLTFSLLDHVMFEWKICKQSESDNFTTCGRYSMSSKRKWE